ncbi:Sepiapterin reductase, partial [Armadillidium nasatum]
FRSAKVDLGSCDAETFECILRDTVGSDYDPVFEIVILVHNAGSLGALNYLANIQDLNAINKFYQLNVSSVIPLTSVFLKIIRGFSTKPKIFVVNISSLCALSPTKSLSLYCSAKAARDMLFKNLALEEGDAIRVLNYAPGPLDNDMQDELRALCEDPEVKEMFTKMKETNQLLPVKTSVEKLILILKENKFESGKHIDFYDY